MRYPVDANVFCEPTRPFRVESVVNWLQANEADFVVDAIVMGEIWHGVDALPEGRKKQNLITWFHEVSKVVACLE